MKLPVFNKKRNLETFQTFFKKFKYNFRKTYKLLYRNDRLLQYNRIIMNFL